jgi:hypothetical protein
VLLSAVTAISAHRSGKVLESQTAAAQLLLQVLALIGEERARLPALCHDPDRDALIGGLDVELDLTQIRRIKAEPHTSAALLAELSAEMDDLDRDMLVGD